MSDTESEVSDGNNYVFDGAQPYMFEPDAESDNENQDNNAMGTIAPTVDNRLQNLVW